MTFMPIIIVRNDLQNLLEQMTRHKDRSFWRFAFALDHHPGETGPKGTYLRSGPAIPPRPWGTREEFPQTPLQSLAHREEKRAWSQRKLPSAEPCPIAAFFVWFVNSSTLMVNTQYGVCSVRLGLKDVGWIKLTRRKIPLPDHEQVLLLEGLRSLTGSRFGLRQKREQKVKLMKAATGGKGPMRKRRKITRRRHNVDDKSPSDYIKAENKRRGRSRPTRQ